MHLQRRFSAAALIVLIATSATMGASLASPLEQKEKSQNLEINPRSELELSRMTPDELLAHQRTELRKKIASDRVNLGYPILGDTELTDLLQTEQGKRTSAELGVPLTGIEEEQARVRLELASTYAALKTPVMTAAGESYAGDWFDKTGDGRIQIYLTGGSDHRSDVQRIFDAAGVSDRLDLVNVTNSLTELNAALDRVVARLRNDDELGRSIATVAVDSHANRVVVQPSLGDIGATTSVAQAFNDEPTVFIDEPVSVPRPLTTAYGGDVLGVATGPWCSLGASARTNIPPVGWIYHWITAGHCGSNYWFHWDTPSSGPHYPGGSTVSIYWDDWSPGDSQAINIPASETSALVRTDVYGPFGLRYLTGLDHSIWDTAGVPFICHSGRSTKANTGSWISCGSVITPSITTVSGRPLVNMRRWSCGYAAPGDSGGTTSGLFYGSYDASLLGFLSAGGSGDCFSTRAGTQISGLGIGEFVLR